MREKVCMGERERVREREREREKIGMDNTVHFVFQNSGSNTLSLSISHTLSLSNNHYLRREWCTVIGVDWFSGSERDHEFLPFLIFHFDAVLLIFDVHDDDSDGDDDDDVEPKSLPLFAKISLFLCSASSTDWSSKRNWDIVVRNDFTPS